MEWCGVIYTIKMYGAAVWPVLDSLFDAIIRKVLGNFQEDQVFEFSKLKL